MNLQKIESDSMIKHAELLHTEMNQQIKRFSEASKEHPKEYKKMYEEIKRPKEVSRQQLPMIVKVNLNRLKNPQQKS